MTRCAYLLGCRDYAESRRQRMDRLDCMNLPRRERYFQLLTVINAWPGPGIKQPALDWSVHAMRGRIRR